ncbi:transcription termination factor MTERF5, chloroplastic [Amborella trichopoda]|uniref:Uncharacterized protein n=1 Tax=Amborella trichopoda TaxID=13333 RepID=U5D3Q8_AMBTC|nr:transcription termination factor MTERF5, chloroplastic [Amborella trichopoda]ERN20246.1 hypothetical protein AMTR_s00066p00157030 [Amborella trichopoda]|eukprot:XP_020531908.1 transcription termination factor MTERF5, chloroplastic [Amborella trichopoda]
MASTKAQSLSKPHYFISFVIPPSLHSYVEQFSTKPLSLSSSPSSLTEAAMTLTSSSPSFMVNLLIDSFGLSKQSAIATSSQFLHLKTDEKPLSVLTFLKNNGFEATHIHDIISKRPRFLVADAEKNLKPKLKLLEDLGLSKFELGAFISANPSILTYSLNKTLLPRILFLKSYLGTDENVLRFVKCCSLLLVSNRLLPNIRHLESHGIGGLKLKSLLLQRPYMFNQKLRRLKEITEKVKELGIESHSKMYSHAVGFMSAMSKETWQRKFVFLKSFGWSEEDICTAFQKRPAIFSLSEEKLQKSMDYFVDELKYDEKYLCFHPHIFIYSLERRLIPRINLLKVLRSRELLKKDANLSSVSVLSEKVFLEKYVLSFREEAESLLKFYKGNKENPRIGAESADLKKGFVTIKI